MKSKQKGSGLFSILKPYKVMIAGLLLLALLSNGISLLLPKIIAHGIDDYIAEQFNARVVILEFLAVTVMVFILTYLQGIIQTYASEKVARDLRSKLSDKISAQSYAYIQQANPHKLLTNLTSDIDSVKLFVSQAIVTIISSTVIITGVSVLLLMMNWKLALLVLLIIPVIGITFFVVLRKVKALFGKSREVIDRLNKVINESILGAALIRVLNARNREYEKFMSASTQARDLGLSILRLFAILIPVISFVANIAILVILAMGGHFVIAGSMSLGDLAAFNSYVTLLIFPILMIGFMSNIIAQAEISYKRVADVLQAPGEQAHGTLSHPLRGKITLKDITVSYGEKQVLKHISFQVEPGTRTAIIGPTAAGKTQLFYLLTGLIKPGSGEILYDDHPIAEYDPQSLLSQTGLVFQDSIIFNTTIRENIAFSDEVPPGLMEKAVETAELKDFTESLPEKLETVISERGANLSGGQKQRIMLARALSLNPRILLLDDFTARVDARTEEKILDNLMRNYPGITLVSITQKIDPVKDYDQIILLMEGEMIAKGTHAELMESCPEYVQIHNSQKSTHHYETAQNS